MGGVQYARAFPHLQRGGRASGAGSRRRPPRACDEAASPRGWRCDLAPPATISRLPDICLRLDTLSHVGDAAQVKPFRSSSRTTVRPLQLMYISRQSGVELTHRQESRRVTLAVEARLELLATSVRVGAAGSEDQTTPRAGLRHRHLRARVARLRTQLCVPGRQGLSGWASKPWTARGGRRAG